MPKGVNKKILLHWSRVQGTTFNGRSRDWWKAL